LGAGAHVVRLSGKIYEAVSALAQRRRPVDLYHSALVVVVPEGRFVIETGPVADGHGGRRGVMAGGPVGTRWAGRARLFRYEIRRWPDGVIADAGEAVASPAIVCDDPVRARRILDLVPSVPAPVWGRDQLDTGEMWNSNSVTSWLLSVGGIDTVPIHPPRGGRAPGWDAGLVVAARNGPTLLVTPDAPRPGLSPLPAGRPRAHPRPVAILRPGLTSAGAAAEAALRRRRPGKERR
jgi:hypothetical protein